MKSSNLIKMANQIAAFFDAMPDRKQAAKDVASHIQRSWEPRMRSSLLQYVGEHGDAELSSLAREALPLLKTGS